MKSRQIQLGGVLIGGGAPVSIQSMCNTNTGDAEVSLAQIARLAALGCEIIRLAVPEESVLPAFQRICAESPLPVIGDIHFDYRLALGALAAGAAGIRINPGNIRDVEKIRIIAREAARLGKVVRIGVNTGSLDPRIEERLGRTPEAMVESAMAYCRIFAEEGCTALKVSLKSSELKTTVHAARCFAECSDIPIHLGVTEAGTLKSGLLKSAIGIGSLLLDGIGDTIRVSLTAAPEEEVLAARQILQAVGTHREGPEVVSCPTCGRTKIDLLPMVNAVENELAHLAAEGKKLPWRKIAVMGCCVNGPGEAKDADIGIAGGNGNGILFQYGKAVCTLPEQELLETLLQKIRQAAQ
ncbi:MAG: flavodoxin-dependent (E)-4-hydroxy-3-methylbut-2-enyl-diphosphate synthase [Lentisphaeria bacterium]